MIIDVHTHLSTLKQWGPTFSGQFKETYPDIDLHGTHERHYAAMASVDKAIVFGINSKAMHMSTPNDSIAEYARQYPDKIIGFMSIDPHEPDAIDEIDRCRSRACETCTHTSTKFDQGANGCRIDRATHHGRA